MVFQLVRAVVVFLLVTVPVIALLAWFMGTDFDAPGNDFTKAFFLILIFIVVGLVPMVAGTLYLLIPFLPRSRSDEAPPPSSRR